MSYSLKLETDMFMHSHMIVFGKTVVMKGIYCHYNRLSRVVLRY